MNDEKIEQLFAIIDKDNLCPNADNQGYKKTESEYHAYQKGSDQMKAYILSKLAESIEDN
jgi:hypothetical protein